MNLNTSPPAKKKRTKSFFINHILLFCNHFAAIGLLLSYIARYASPERYWVIAFFGLAYPVFVGINFLFVIYWSIQLNKYLLYSLLIIFAGWTNLRSFVQINLFKETPSAVQPIKVMSYNVKVFDLYNWTHNLDTRSEIFKLLNEESPDIICFQEFFSKDNSAFDNMQLLSSALKAKNIHVEYTSHSVQNQHWGIATFSSFPIISKGKIDFGYKSNNACIYTDVVIAADTIRIYNMHLQSIAFGVTDYQYMDDLEKNKETEDIVHSKSIGKRLKHAFIKRAKQAELIHNSIAQSPYPVIVCGDFNDTPASYTYTTIAKGLNDAFIKAGYGFGKTYVGKFPSFRIDYILYGNEFNATSFKTVHKELSDHYPVVTSLIPISK